MSYLHCHNCGFSQDDYWSKNGWNPIKAFQNDLDDLIDKDLDEVVGMDSAWLTKEVNGYKDYEKITRRELVLYHLWQIENRIKRMVYRTPQELKEKNPERKCPKCGEKKLDED